jgi:hypothetical protein
MGVKDVQDMCSTRMHSTTSMYMDAGLQSVMNVPPQIEGKQRVVPLSDHGRANHYLRSFSIIKCTQVGVSRRGGGACDVQGSV